MKSAKELIIVEGLSAANAIKSVSNETTHRVHAMQGKLLNVTAVAESEVLKDEACASLIGVLECGFGTECNANQLPYSRILIAMDPDTDGSHSAALLLTLFGRFLKPLVESEKLYVLRMPMFRIQQNSTDAPLTEAATHAVTHAFTYAWSDEELSKIKDQQNTAQSPISLTRFKGIAQLNAACNPVNLVFFVLVQFYISTSRLINTVA